MERNWITIGHIDDIPPRGARIVKTARGDVAVFRTADGAVFALADRCPHQGGPLSQGMVHGRTVTCPLHEWRIALDTGQAVAPDEGCVARYAVRVVNERIELCLAPLGATRCEPA